MTPGQSQNPIKDESADKQRREMRRLVEIYAIRARQLSDAIASLGWYVGIEARFQETILDIRRLRALCDKAGSDLLAFVDQEEAGHRDHRASQERPGNPEADSKT